MPVAQSSSVESSLHHGGRETLVNLLQSMLGIGTAHADTLKERLQASGMSGAAASHLTDAALALNGPRSLDSSKRASAAMAAAVTAIAPYSLIGALTRAMMEMNSSKYQAASATVKNGDVVYTNSNGSQNIRSGGASSWRNNNPGNMVAGAPGFQPIEKNGTSTIFADYSSGFNAIVANLHTAKYFNGTVGDAIKTWAPAADNNDPVAYAKDVAAWTGVSAQTQMNTLTPAQINSVAHAIQREEGWIAGTETHVAIPTNR